MVHDDRPVGLEASRCGLTTSAWSRTRGARWPGALAARLGLDALLVSVRLGTFIALLVASSIAGAAQGAIFAGSLSALPAEAAPAERAGLLSAVYLISYSGAPIHTLVAPDRPRTRGGLFGLGCGALAAVACIIAPLRL
jgi:hypothetical protein